ncbi:hypothetical protein GCM10009687_63270 [Asanoa iriomotensis]|uniref:Uncharacterized protein n=1 Tax=Asanoa iriomotensis TaxID=234613 RepID=A0ABQ4C4C3_9ACTN|nr:hypothetical protein [Asanoa iriomotensis]GIF57632.1 hypothetical protein Air01nite_37270 [Asanoa iriomotensis]
MPLQNGKVRLPESGINRQDGGISTTLNHDILWKLAVEPGSRDPGQRRQAQTARRSQSVSERTTKTGIAGPTEQIAADVDYTNVFGAQLGGRRCDLPMDGPRAP